MEIDSFLSPCTNLKSKWIKDLHIKADILNLIEERVKKSLKYMGIRENFLNRIPKAYTIRSTIDNLIKLQSF